jgi:hypothetical protein
MSSRDDRTRITVRMVRVLGLLLLCAGLAVAQERDEGGISIDEKPSGPEADPEAKPGPAREPGKQVATVAVAKKIYSFSVPADWVMIESEEADTELAWEVLLPGSTRRGSLILARNDNFGDPRCAPYLQERWLKKDRPDLKTEVRLQPCPRLLEHRFLHETDWIDLFLWVSVRNNLYVFRLACATADFAQAERDILATVQSFDAKVEIWPPIPKGYEVSQQGAWLIARAPSVKASLTPLVKALNEVEKRFRRDHGPLPKSDTPLVVLVHNSQGDAARIDPDASQGMSGFWADERRRRLFAVPIDKDNDDQRGWLASFAQGVLYFARYGDTSPWWVFSGERSVARAEAITRKPLPSLDAGFVSWISKLHLHTLDEIEAKASAANPDWSAINTEYFFYVAMLREGRYKKEYRAFLKEFAETGDGEGAFAHHLGTIDQQKLRDSTNEFTTKIREVKRDKE